MARRRCPVCGSKKWHKEPSSGLIICSEGHVLQNYRNETIEATEFGPHAVTRRTLKSNRKKKEKGSRADPKLYHGPRARFHYFQCLQLMLRKQIATLTALWALPPEFEIVCRDIWALHLSLLPNPPSAEPLHYAQEQGGMNTSKDGEASLPTKSSEDKGSGLEDELRVEGEENDPSSSSSDTETEEEPHEDPELAALMRELSESSSSEVEVDPTSQEPGDGGKGKVKRQYFKCGQYETPASNLAVLMVAFWTMRMPVMYADMIRLAESYDLPYLDPISRNLIPPSMSLHLTKHTTAALSPHHTPRVLALHAQSTRLAKLLYSSYGISTPELNAAPLLWRAVCGLGGTPTLYNLTKSVSRTLSLNLTIHYSLGPQLEKLRHTDPDFYHKYDNVPPEAALVAAVVVVLKMTYGLDGRERTPLSGREPGCSLPKIDEYIAHIRKLEEAEEKNVHDMLTSTSQMNVIELDSGQLDAYLDFCDKALLGTRDFKQEPSVLSHLFPLKRTNPEAPENPILKPQHPSLSASVPDNTKNGDELRPGESYRIYNARDIFGTLPGEYETVVQRGGRWAGVSDECVNAIVERFERRLVRWWEGVKRQEKRKSAGENRER
ncbi:hypothetical protein JAAARDRAFT_52507 [Jaapia argillacea MUCL 33604]|uniref:RRN7-type domain-containing protein n=1 Tax=Jaapia argillacea MUCL 33604 TaxID=933084 RepID=A0A067QPJ7_9AGAM|nr:hypothetical protein JAAARDRAFT_52507 [Jaapia argillacea MUCL 33604]